MSAVGLPQPRDALTACVGRPAVSPSVYRLDVMGSPQLPLQPPPVATPVAAFPYLCVFDLHDRLRIPQPKTSGHLAYLRREGVVEAEKRHRRSHPRRSRIVLLCDRCEMTPFRWGAGHTGS
jgi:hypothetical protein